MPRSVIDSGQLHYYSVNPTVNDGLSAGFDYGSEWLNLVTGDMFKCVDPTDGAAVWEEHVRTADLRRIEDNNASPSVFNPVTMNNYALYQAIQTSMSGLDFFWQVHRTTTGNNNMSNGAWFYNFGGRYLTGSWSGYASNCTPLQIPYNCRIKTIILTFRYAAFDWLATAGQLHASFNFQTHAYDGSSTLTDLGIRFGNFSGNNTGTSTHRYVITSFEEIVGTNYFPVYELLGVRFLKTAQPDGGAINSWIDPVITFHFGPI